MESFAYRQIKAGTTLSGTARAVVLFALVLFGVVGCNSGKESSTTDKLIGEFNAALSDAKKAIQSVAPDPNKVSADAQEEVEKLFVFEYKVIEVEEDLEAAKVEAKLAALGKERWDCFSVERVSSKLRLYCKRAPKTYLRYVPRMF